MDQPPKKLITRILEFAVMFALSALLIRIGICLIAEIWYVLLIGAIVIVIAVVCWRIYANRPRW